MTPDIREEIVRQLLDCGAIIEEMQDGDGGHLSTPEERRALDRAHALLRLGAVLSYWPFPKSPRPRRLSLRRRRR